MSESSQSTSGLDTANADESSEINTLAACDVGAVVSFPEEDSEQPVQLVGFYRAGEYNNGIWAAVDAETGEFAGLHEDSSSSSKGPVSVTFHGWAKDSLPTEDEETVSAPADELETIIEFVRDDPALDHAPETDVVPALETLTESLPDSPTIQRNSRRFPNRATCFSEAERKRIIRDIMHWRVEREENHRLPNDEFRDYINDLRTNSDERLRERWRKTVGDWVASRHDVHKPSGVDFDTFLATQFGRLIDGDNTAYGFVVSAGVPPEAGVKLDPEGETT